MSVNGCICGSGFGMNLSCPMHGVQTAREAMSADPVQREPDGVAESLFKQIEQFDAGCAQIAARDGNGEITRLVYCAVDDTARDADKVLAALAAFYESATPDSEMYVYIGAPPAQASAPVQGDGLRELAEMVVAIREKINAEGYLYVEDSRFFADINAAEKLARAALSAGAPAPQE